MMLQIIFRYTSKILPSSEDSLFYFHLIKRVQLFYIHFLPFWAANGSFNKHLFNNNVFPIAQTFQ